MTTTTDPQPVDPRPIYLGATAWVTSLLTGVGEGQLHLPTPCDEYDVQTLSSHLIGTVSRVIAIAEVGDAEAVAPLAPEHDAATFAQLADAAQRAWADDALLDTPVTVPWGQAPGREAMWGYIGEALVHGWDLAVATGQPCEAGPADHLATFQLHMLGAVAQLERALIRERQREGIALARQRGVYRGRGRRLDAEQVAQARQRVADGVPKAKVARELSCSRQSLYAALGGTGAYAEESA